MSTFADRIRAALDDEAQDIELSIRNEIEGLYADGGTVMTREEILTFDAEEEGGGPYTRRLRMVAAHRKILGEHGNDGGTCEVCHSPAEREVMYDGEEEHWSMVSSPLRWPCPTALAIAEAHGVEA